jgi:hypothetical protein
VVLMSCDSDAVDEQTRVPYVVQTTRIDGSYERHDQLVTDNGQLANRPRQLFGSSIYPAVNVDDTAEKTDFQQLLVKHKQKVFMGVGVLVLVVALLYTL